MIILKNRSLQAHNTFGLSESADNLLLIDSEKDLQAALELAYRPIYILGGGSNILLTQTIKGLVLKNEIKGIRLVKNTKSDVTIQVGAGENWHQLVLWCINKGYGGIENLSLIPGTVGAAPIQNIGAYGVELKDVFEKLEAIDLTTGEKRIFSKAACLFAYRESIFKKQYKGRYCITKVYLKLRKAPHQLYMDYGAIKAQLEKHNIQQPTIKDISDAVIHIRSSKLPDPAKLGNAGSFFKNPTISRKEFEQLQKQFSNIVFYELSNGEFKIPAGWLIEQCGWKGKRLGPTGAHAKQALVLVNYGDAEGKQVLELARQIIVSVQEKFDIQLTMEVNVLE